MKTKTMFWLYRRDETSGRDYEAEFETEGAMKAYIRNTPGIWKWEKVMVTKL